MSRKLMISRLEAAPTGRMSRFVFDYAATGRMLDSRNGFPIKTLGNDKKIGVVNADL